MMTMFEMQQPPAPLTPYQFLMRFTQPERSGIRTEASSDAVLSDFLYVLDHAQEVIITDPMIKAAVNYLTTVPASSPILTAARASAILS